jgi:hypothetical protein
MGAVLNDARAAKWLSLGTLVLAGVGVMTAGYFVVQQFTGGGYNNGSIPRVVTVVGTGTKTFKPAKAEVSFSYVYQDTGRDQTESAGDQKFNSIIQGLNQYQPIEVSKTTPQVVQSGQTTGLAAGAAQGTRYQYVNAARVKAGNPDQIRDIVSYLYAQGAATVTQVRYIPDNEEKANSELRELAVKDAKMKAQDLVKATGSKIGKVMSIQEGTASTQASGSVIDSSANLAGVASATGDIELQSIVTVSYEVR